MSRNPNSQLSGLEPENKGLKVKNKYYYHFTSDKLRDGRPIPKRGEWIEHKGEIKPCVSGLHASAHPFDALQYAPGAMLHLVELGGVILEHGDPVDKVCAEKRRIVKTINAEKLLRDFARRVALDALPLWKDAPEAVKEYLRTGDEKLRDAAWAAARDAARAAARGAARDAARDAAWDAKIKLYRKWFKEMTIKEFKRRKLHEKKH